MFIRNGNVTGSIYYADLPENKPAKKTPRSTEEKATPEQGVADSPDADAAPKDYAPKHEWVDFAVGQGADRDEAESLTKAELVEMYGDKS